MTLMTLTYSERKTEADTVKVPPWKTGADDESAEAETEAS